jgi:large subunit ribosomal protein L25
MVIPGGVAGHQIYEGNCEMSEQLTLPAETRDRAGKGASRALRREGRVPAVVYGDRKEPLSVHVEEKLLLRMLNSGHFMNSVVMVEVDGKPNRTLPKDVQFHPVSSRPVHVDFLRIGEHSKVNVNIPVRFDNEEASPGLKRGGVLNIVQHEIELICDAAEIPDEIHVDLTGLEIGDSIHISEVKLPTGAKPVIDDRDFTVATLVAPSAMKQTEEEAAAAEGEVPTVGEEEAEGEAEAEAEAEGGAAEGGEES